MGTFRNLAGTSRYTTLFGLCCFVGLSKTILLYLNSSPPHEQTGKCVVKDLIWSNTCSGIPPEACPTIRSALERGNVLLAQAAAGHPLGPTEASAGDDAIAVAHSAGPKAVRE